MVHVYVQPNCHMCKATIHRLDKRGKRYEVRQLAEHPDILRRATEAGMSSAPIVTYQDTMWSGFNPERIEAV